MTGNKLFHTLLVMTGLDVALHGAFFAMEISYASIAKQLAAAIDKVLPGKLLEEAICDADETLLLLGRLGLMGLQRIVGLDLPLSGMCSLSGSSRNKFSGRRRRNGPSLGDRSLFGRLALGLLGLGLVGWHVGASCSKKRQSACWRTGKQTMNYRGHKLPHKRRRDDVSSILGGVRGELGLNSREKCFGIAFVKSARSSNQ